MNFILWNINLKIKVIAVLSLPELSHETLVLNYFQKLLSSGRRTTSKFNPLFISGLFLFLES